MFIGFSMNSTKRILLVNVRSLLLEGVEGLLESNGNGKLEVISTLANNLADLIGEVEQLKPSVIVIDEVTSFINAADLIASLLNVQNMRLIVLSSETSKMEIYDRSESIISNLDHFIDALSYKAASSL